MTTPDIDVLVLGGGIQGAGIAQAAAARGHRVLLVEKGQPADGTSSRSSKLIHGGLRYLESAQFGLVRESLRERAILCRIAPDLVRMVPFVLPVRRGAARRPWQLRLGLGLYSLLGGLGPDTRFETIPRRRWDELDGLRCDDVEAVFRYQDGQTDDAALTRAVLASAVELGARVWVESEFLRAEVHSDKVCAWVRRGRGERRVEARVLVNATGPWAERIAERIDPRPRMPSIECVAGSHVEIEGRPQQGCYYLEAPQDGRGVFVMPWKGHGLIGTTERPHDGDPGAVVATPAEVDYLREALAHHFPSWGWRPYLTWAGLRVLPRGDGAAFDRPRDVLLVPTGEGRQLRILSVVGGKLTGYRSTAERAMRRLAQALPSAARKADTATLRLPAPSPACDRPVSPSSAPPAP